jgi:hypothetical protein
MTAAQRGRRQSFPRLDRRHGVTAAGAPRRDQRAGAQPGGEGGSRQQQQAAALRHGEGFQR